MHIIIMPPQLIIIGMPICVMPIMFSQHFMNMSFMEASMGIISQVMPLAVMVHFIWQLIIGIMDIALAIMGFIMPAIIMGIGIICIAGFIIVLQIVRQDHTILRMLGRLTVSLWCAIGECDARSVLSKKTTGLLTRLWKFLL